MNAIYDSGNFQEGVASVGATSAHNVQESPACNRNAANPNQNLLDDGNGIEYDLSYNSVPNFGSGPITSYQMGAEIQNGSGGSIQNYQLYTLSSGTLSPDGTGTPDITFTLTGQLASVFSFHPGIWAWSVVWLPPTDGTTGSFITVPPGTFHIEIGVAYPASVPIADISTTGLNATDSNHIIGSNYNSVYSADCPATNVSFDGTFNTQTFFGYGPRQPFSLICKVTLKDANAGSTFGAGLFTFRATRQADPYISTQPTNSTVAHPHFATFNVVAYGASTLTYQWQTFSSSWSNLVNNTIFNNVTTDTLFITDSTGLNGTQYRCVVTDALGSVTSSAATLTVT